MDISIQGNNIVIADNVRTYAQERLTKLSRYLPNIIGIRTDITKQEHSRGPDEITVQITVRHSRGAILRAEEKSALTGGGDAVTPGEASVETGGGRLGHARCCPAA